MMWWSLLVMERVSITLLLLLQLQLTCLVSPVHGFGVGQQQQLPSLLSQGKRIINSRSVVVVTKATPDDDDKNDNDVRNWRVRRIKDALDDMQVSYTDCFDKESLVERYNHAVQQQQQQPQATTTTPGSPPSSATASSTESGTSTVQQDDDEDDENNKKLLLDELRGMSVKALRQELASRQIRWAGLLEKQDLVRAVYEARQAAAQFSATGLVEPGRVTALSGDQVLQELVDSKNYATPLLVDVFATWCGPCQLMATQLEQAAQEFNTRVRVVKMDSDANPVQASQWQIQGLPTLLLFNDGKLIARFEGAMMRDQIVDWVHTQLLQAQQQQQQA